MLTMPISWRAAVYNGLCHSFGVRLRRDGETPPGARPLLGLRQR